MFCLCVQTVQIYLYSVMSIVFLRSVQFSIEFENSPIENQKEKMRCFSLGGEKGPRAPPLKQNSNISENIVRTHILRI